MASALPIVLETEIKSKGNTMANQLRLEQKLSRLRDRYEEKHPAKGSSNEDLLGPVQEDWEDLSLKKKIQQCEDALHDELVRPGTNRTYGQEDERMKAAAKKPASNDDLLGAQESENKKRAGLDTGLTVEKRHAQSPEAKLAAHKAAREDDRQHEARLKTPAQKEADDKAFRERMREKMAGKKRGMPWN
jgi:hypothetical protein